MTIKMQKSPQKKITKQMAKPAKPACEGMGMAPKHRGGNLGAFLHPPKGSKSAAPKRKG